MFVRGVGERGPRSGQNGATEPGARGRAARGGRAGLGGEFAGCEAGGAGFAGWEAMRGDEDPARGGGGFGSLARVGHVLGEEVGVGEAAWEGGGVEVGGGVEDVRRGGGEVLPDARLGGRYRV